MLIDKVDAASLVLLSQDSKSQGQVHISYHGDYHYNSLRVVAPVVRKQQQATEQLLASEQQQSSDPPSSKQMVLQAVPWASAADVEAALILSEDSVETATQ